MMENSIILFGFTPIPTGLKPRLCSRKKVLIGRVSRQNKDCSEYTVSAWNGGSKRDINIEKIDRRAWQLIRNEAIVSTTIASDSQHKFLVVFMMTRFIRRHEYTLLESSRQNVHGEFR